MVKMLLGVRVARSFPDGKLWAGTVVKETAHHVVVRWDYGEESQFDKGDGTLQIYVIDSAPSGVQHTGSKCKECGVSPIPGFCWFCKECRECLCSRCYFGDKHFTNHTFERINAPDGERTEVGNRCSLNYANVSGMFPGAVVVHGPDWDLQCYSDDTHGTVGTVIIGDNPSDEDLACKGMVQVLWNYKEAAHFYQLGFNGKVDIKLKCKESSAATFQLYTDHLPQLSELSCQIRQTSNGLQVGDRVSVTIEEDILECIFQGDPDQLGKVRKLRNRTGLVTEILRCGKVAIRYQQENLECCENILCKIPVPDYQVNDMVQVIDDIDIIKTVQEGHGGWRESMKKALGKSCRVVKVDKDGDVHVVVNNDSTGTSHIFNPTALECLSTSTISTNQRSTNVDEAEENISNEAPPCAEDTPSPNKFQELFSSDNPHSRTPASFVGSTWEPNSQLSGESVKNHLTEECKARMLQSAANLEEFSPLHRAVFLGDNSEAEKLIASQPELISVSLATSGYTALHIAVHNNNLEMVKLLLTKKLEINHRNKLGQTPLHIAANQGNFGVVKMLVKYGADVNCKDDDGDIALTLIMKQQVLPLAPRSVAHLLPVGGDATKNTYRRCDFCMSEALINVFFSPCGHKLCSDCFPKTTEISQCFKCNSYVRRVIRSDDVPAAR